MKDSLQEIRQDQQSLDDKTFSSHLFKIVAIPVVVIFLTLIFSHFEGQYRDRLRDGIETYDSILIHVIHLEKNYSDMETSERGFVISGKESFLAPFRKSKEQLPEIQENLFKSIGGDYSLSSSLRVALDKYNIWLEHAERARPVSSVDFAKVESHLAIGKKKFDDLREAIKILRQEVIIKKIRAKQYLKNTRQWTMYLEFLITILFVGFLALILTKQLKNLTRSYRSLLKSNLLAIEAIEKAARSKDLFLANMSHEIRTPLGAIMGFAELAGQNKELNPTMKNYISFIRRNSEHLLNLIDDLFDLSKLTADKLEIYYDEVNMLTFIDDIKNLFSGHVVDKKLHLNLIVKDKIPHFIMTDRVRLKQIVSNLVGNAIKFSDAGSKVDIIFSISDKENILDVDVIDQGIGIPDEAQKNIFEAFRQVDANHSRKYGGAGLGLSISKKLAEALKGDVYLVESKINVGSHFRLRLKISTQTQDYITQQEVSEPHKATMESDQHEAPHAKIKLQNKTILLAEDSKENQILFKIFIEPTLADLTIVENGTEAIRLALKDKYDLILMDIQMPGLDGYEAVRILRTSNYQGKIVALTAHTMKGEREKCLASGFDGYLSKPVSQIKLLRTIKDTIGT